MTELDIVEENENYRVRLEYDDSGIKPWGDFQTPVLSKEFRYGSWEADNDAAEEFSGTVNEAWDRLKDVETFERFIRIFLGAKSVIVSSSENRHYVSFDTPEWREHTGLTDEYLADTPEVKPEELAKGTLDEYIAWANGEVYGYIVEKKFITQTKYIDPVTEELVNVEDDIEWVEVEDGSCWGFYGREWAEESAKEALKSATER